MEFISTTLAEYCNQHSEPEPDYLHHIYRQSHLRTLRPRMVSGHLQGRFLATISAIAAPKFIVEIGTFTGYSALCLAEGLIEGGRLITIEKDPEFALLASELIAQAPKHLANAIEIKSGNAIDTIRQLDYPIDLAFIDAEKLEYKQYLDLLLPKIKLNGLIIVDNVLWSGKVTDPLATDPETEAIKQFNHYVRHHPKLNATLLPLRDGITLIRKIAE